MCGATSQVTAHADRSVLPAMKRSSIAMRRLHFASKRGLSRCYTRHVVSGDTRRRRRRLDGVEAPDGLWRAATRAIAFAIANCKIAYQREIGCGAFFTSIQAGYTCHCWGGQ
jgi:hypothetical protein